MVGEGEGDGQLWGSGRGAIAGCHCTALWWGKGRVTANFGGVDVVPLQGAIVACYGWGDDQLWGSGRGAFAGCHCSVLWLGGHFSFTLITDNPKIGFCYLGSMLV